MTKVQAARKERIEEEEEDMKERERNVYSAKGGFGWERDFEFEGR